MKYTHFFGYFGQAYKYSESRTDTKALPVVATIGLFAKVEKWVEIEFGIASETVLRGVILFNLEPIRE